MDGGTDTAADTFVDASADTLANDTGTTPETLPDADSDANLAFGPFSGPWRRLSGFPAACNLLVPDNLGTQVPPLVWTACTSGRTGCTHEYADWSVVPGRKFVFGQQPDGFRMINGSPYMVYSRLWPSPTALQQAQYFMEVVQTTDGTVQFAYTNNLSDHCGVGLGAGTAGVALVGGSDTLASTEIMGFSKWASVNSFDVQLVVYSAFGRPYLSGGDFDSDYWFNFADSSGMSGYGFTIYSPTTHSVVNPYVSTLPHTAIDALTHDGAYLTRTDQTAFDFMDRLTGVETLVRQAAAGQVVAVVEVDRSSGDVPVWTETAAGSAVTSLTLYTGSHATAAATLATKTVGTIAVAESAYSPVSMLANAGYVLQQTSMTSAVVVRLSDGMGWTVSSEATEGFSQALWVDATEAWFATSPLKSPGGTPFLPSDIYNTPTGIMRIRLDSLGAISKVLGP
ncbi:MAG: hypothetical protein ACHREM_15580 [Polyangiales bacterium]